MSTISRPTAGPAERGRGVGRVLLTVVGSLAAIVALALLLGGLALLAAQTQRDGDGFFTTPTERFSTGAYALTHEGLDVGDVDDTPDWLVDRLGTVRIRATSADGRPLFVGVARESGLDGYLSGVAHDEVRSVTFDPFRTDVRTVGGGAPAAPPSARTIWAASAVGAGTQTVTWDVAAGTWALVVMNADASPAVAADIEFGAEATWLPWVAVALLVAGVLTALVAAALIGGAVRTPAAAADSPVAASAGTLGETKARGETEARSYPVAVEARLEEPLSRWLWLVKWLLAVPHLVVLALLWPAVVVVTVVAFVAILVTGRYPRVLFEFNLGVLRWTWRVGFYALSTLGTDRYPPFSLGAEPHYPATLDVPYPARLSRGLVLVKSWLLALPHLVVVAILTGSVTWGWSGRSLEWPGLIPVLALVAGVVLLVQGRYHRDLFTLLVGLNRWVYRVAAYVLLMRDEYPPFRLER